MSHMRRDHYWTWCGLENANLTTANLLGQVSCLDCLDKASKYYERFDSHATACCFREIDRLSDTHWAPNPAMPYQAACGVSALHGSRMTEDIEKVTCPSCAMGASVKGDEA